MRRSSVPFWGIESGIDKLDVIITSPSASERQGHTIDFYLSQTRNTKSAKRFLQKALNGFKEEERLSVKYSNKAPTYRRAIASLKRKDKLREKLEQRPTQRDQTIRTLLKSSDMPASEIATPLRYRAFDSLSQCGKSCRALRGWDQLGA